MMIQVLSTKCNKATNILFKRFGPNLTSRRVDNSQISSAEYNKTMNTEHDETT